MVARDRIELPIDRGPSPVVNLFGEQARFRVHHALLYPFE